MALIPLFCNGVVLTNGEDFSHIQSGHTITLKGVTCILNAQLDLENPKRNMSNILLVETPYLGDENGDFAELIKTLQDALDTVAPFTKLVSVRESVEYYIRSGTERVKREARVREFVIKLSELEEEYKHLHPELVSMVKDFDHYYSYTDDINVYRRGVEREKFIKDELKKAGALDFFTKYRAII